ncbi:MAG: hypothetical protein QOE26_464 [Verrucomicrobiota bacterium]|jgi:hypothetical protein
MPERKPPITQVTAFPAKSFFVSMLTRDIELQDAILDLLDNCVDGATRSRSSKARKEDSFEGFWARIEFSEKRFVIEDNCGGIPWKLAEEHAFRMGKPDGAQLEEGTIGIVGIGMKRAIFKMGRECHVHSNHSDDSFLVTIIPDWFNDDQDWIFPAERETPVLKERGTIVEISELSEPTKLAFNRASSFRETFPEAVAEAYSYLIEKGFAVTINGVRVKRHPVKLCFEDKSDPRKKSDSIRPFIYTAAIDGVNVFCAVGYRSRLPTPEEQNDEKEATFAASEAGWTVVCNDRVVLSNDRGVPTGWGFGGVPNFHNQFSCIAGVVEFESPDTSKLPLTTTKRGVDTSRDIYTLVRQKMQEGLKHFTRNTNRWKGSESELKDRFDKSPYIGLTELKAIAGRMPLRTITGNFPQRQFKPNLPEKKKLITEKRICFVKPIKEIDAVSIVLFDESREANEVGEECFNRFLARPNE